MPRSVKIHPARKEQVISALERNGFLTQGDLASTFRDSFIHCQQLHQQQTRICIDI
jgi:hypothetical protein